MRATILRCALPAALAASVLPARQAETRNRPDAWVTMKAKMKLLTADNLHAGSVHVDTLGGVVTLYGTVPTSAEKAKAELDVRSIEGVKAVKNQLKVQAPARPEADEAPVADPAQARRRDAEIQDRVSRSLRQDRSLDASSITVKGVQDGVVTLAGRAATGNDYIHALRLASSVPGVRRVNSEMTGTDSLDWAEDRASGAGQGMSQGAGQSGAQGGGQDLRAAVSDTGITSEIKSRFLADSRTPATDINVDTDGGVVSLYGLVSSEEARRAAEDIARRVDGVKRVDNNLQVVPRSQQPAVQARDEDLARQVRSALAEQQRAAGGQNVSVEVNNGIVRLTGLVSSRYEGLSLAYAARSVPGVRAVRNDLRIESPAPAPQSQEPPVEPRR